MREEEINGNFSIAKSFTETIGIVRNSLLYFAPPTLTPYLNLKTAHKPPQRQ
jgi:hypothetical protein